jgi:hypothetical protein
MRRTVTTSTPLDRYRDPYHEADTLVHLGDTHRSADNPDAAREAWRQAMTILDDLHHPDADKARTRLHRPANRPVPSQQATHVRRRPGREPAPPRRSMLAGRP